MLNIYSVRYTLAATGKTESAIARGADEAEALDRFLADWEADGNRERDLTAYFVEHEIY